MATDIPADEDLYRLVKSKWYFASQNLIVEDAFALRDIEGEAPVWERGLSMTRSSLRSPDDTRAGWMDERGRGPGVAAFVTKDLRTDFEDEIEGAPHHVILVPLRRDGRGQVLFEVQSKLVLLARMRLLPVPARG